jgi:long-subunit fatty acid transport protein
LAEAPEILFDLAAIRSYYGVELVGQDLVVRRGVSPLPFLAMATPLGERFGLGFHVGVPFARVGESAADGPFRMWTISGGILVVEPRLSLAWKASDKWTLGAGLRAGFSFFNMKAASDTGATLYQLLGETAEDLIGDPLLEGTRTVEGGRGFGLAYSFGIRFEPVKRVVFVLSHHTTLSTPLEGTVVIQPSNDLDLVLQAGLVGQWRYPMEIHAGLSVPAGAVDLHAHAEYIGWGSTTKTLATLNDPVVLSESPLLSGILHDYGLDDPAALGTLETSSESGMQNILTGGVHISWQPNDQWMFLAGASYTPGAIRDEWISPANIDMGGFDYRVGSKWTATDHLEFGLSLDIWALSPRTIRTSIGDPRNTLGNPTTPNANGRYELVMQRLGMSSRVGF